MITKFVHKDHFEISFKVALSNFWVISCIEILVFLDCGTDIYWTPRSSRPEVFLGKVVLQICSKFTGEHPCLCVISIKLQSNFIEITFRLGCFPVNLLHIFRTPFQNNTSGWLLLNAYDKFNPTHTPYTHKNEFIISFYFSCIWKINLTWKVSLFLFYISCRRSIVY